MAVTRAFLKQAARSIREKGTSIVPYALGRFYFVRKFYSAQAHLRIGVIAQPVADSIFPEVDVETAIAAIRRDSVYLPVHLPQACIDEFHALALRSPLEANTSAEPFYYEDVRDGRLTNGDVVAMGHVIGIENHPLAQRVARDPKAMMVVSRYLNYTPKQCDVLLFWSFAGGLTIEQRRAAAQTVDFHFDVHSYNFAYAAYYITDTDRRNGAHVMVLGSHSNKPTSWLFGSATQTVQTIEREYGKEKVLCIEGKAGTGFWQDSSCYHRALPPESGDRLLLQVRYF